jgi:hypothetical protein
VRKSISSLLGAALLPFAALADPPPKALAQRQEPLEISPLLARSTPAESRAALLVTGSDEPTLEQAQRAAERIAAGDREADSSRRSRARAAHFAPVVRGQLGRAQVDQSRSGVSYGQPVQWNTLGQTTTWAVTLAWDLPSAIYGRDENQLALSESQLARVRREVAQRVGRLYAERKRKLLAMHAQPGSDASLQLENALSLLELTAELDGLSGGLFAAALARAQDHATALSRSLHLEETP